MAEVRPSLASTAGVAAFGLQISTSIHTYVEAVWEAKDRLRDVAIDINATASTLKQLQGLIDADATQTTKVFKDAGLGEVNSLSTSCGKVYSLIVVLLTKAGTPESQGKITAESIDVFTLKTSILTRHMRWRWLGPRIKRCQGQLRLFKTKLMLNLQLAQLARVQLGIPARQPGAFQEEFMLRALSFKLRRKELRAFRLLADKYNVKVDNAASEVSSLFSGDRVEIIVREGSTSAVVDIVEEEQSAESEKDIGAISSESGVTTDTPKTETTSQTSIDAKPDAETASECGTLVNEFPSEKTEEADLKKPAAEEIIARSPPEIKVEVTKVGELDVKAPEATEEAKKEESSKEEQVKPEHEAIDLPSSSGTFNFLPTWLKDLFGKNDRKFLHDWESPTLECFIVSREFKLHKLPFGHQRLTYGLKRTQRKIGLTWDQYMGLDSPHKKEISKAINKAKSLDSRQRTCVAIGAQKKFEDDFVVLFLTLGPKVEPIKFKDAVGRLYNVPFENCKTFEKFKQVVDEAFLHVEVLGPHVMAGHFDLTDSNGTIILPSLWTSLIQPGDSISMHMWPMPPEPPRPSTFFNPSERIWPGPPPPPQIVGPPRPPPVGWQPLATRSRLGRGFNIPPPPPPNFPPPPRHQPGPSRGPNIIVPGPPPPIINIHHPSHTFPILCKPTESISVYSWLKGRTKPGPRHHRRYSYSSSDSDDSSVDGSTICSHSDIECEESDTKVLVDWEKEEAMRKLKVQDLLGRWTHATDTIGGEELDSDGSSSGSSSSGSESLVDD